MGEEEKDHFGGEEIWTKLKGDNAGCFLVRVCFGEIASIWLLLDDRLLNNGKTVMNEMKKKPQLGQYPMRPAIIMML